jgi:hypothetical protein
MKRLACYGLATLFGLLNVMLPASAAPAPFVAQNKPLEQFVCRASWGLVTLFSARGATAATFVPEPTFLTKVVAVAAWGGTFYGAYRTGEGTCSLRPITTEEYNTYLQRGIPQGKLQKKQ